MMKDTRAGQTNHCPLCEEAGRKLAAAQAEIERLKCTNEKLVERYENAASDSNKLLRERNNLLTNQSSFIELRKEIARLQTTIQGLVAEREALMAQEPFAWIDPQEIPLSESAAHIYLTNENFDGNTIPLYAAPPAPAVPEFIDNKCPSRIGKTDKGE